MGCENLATKSDITAINSKLDQIISSLSNLPTKSDVSNLDDKITLLTSKVDSLLVSNNDNVAKVDNIWSFLASLVDSIVSPIRLLIVEFGNTVQSLIFSVRDVIIQGLNSTENVITTGITSSERVITSAITASENVIKGGLQTVNNAIDSVESTIKTGFDTVGSVLNNIIDSLENIVITITQELYKLLNNIVEELYKLSNNIVDSLTTISITIIESVRALISDVLSQLLFFMREELNQLRAWLLPEISNILDRILDALVGENDNNLLSRLTGIDNKLGAFPNGCGLYTNFGSVSDALQMLVCGYDTGNGNTLSQAELMNLLNQILNGVNNINGDNNNNNNEPSLSDKITDIYNRLGVNQYPVTVPLSLTGTSTNTTQIQSLTQFQSWQTKQIYNMLGRYPIDIHIEDSDLIKVGNQSVDLEFKNVSETLAEILGLLILSKAKEDALLNIGLRNLMETGSCRKQVIVNHFLTEAIQSYLGFKTKQKTETVKFLFNPLVGSDGEAENLIKALTNSEQTIKVEEEDEDQTLEQKLTILIEGARIIKGRFFEKLSPNNIDEWVQNIKDLSDTADSTNTEDFDAYLEKIEQGFISEGGITDQTHPYGRDYEQRPRIKEIGIEQPDGGQNV